MAEAETLRARGEAPAVRQALAKYQEAESLFAAAGDRLGQARAVYGTGRAHDWLSEKRSAREADRPGGSRCYRCQWRAQ
ncbi:MAG: hypothetical protein ABSF54_28755 [Bryobacteraceae bacterium]